MAPRVAFRGDSIMVWDGTLFRGRTELIIYRNRSVTAKKYHDDIILMIVSRLRPLIECSFLNILR
jgi:hypothetical protein